MGKMKYWLIAGFIILLAIVYTAISDRDSTLSRLKSAGENGDVEAQYALGLMYLYGEILDVDYQPLFHTKSLLSFHLSSHPYCIHQ